MWMNLGCLVAEKKLSKEVVLVHLEYADDMVVRCDSMEDLKCFVREVDRVFREIGMIISAKQLCVMVVSPPMPSDGEVQDVCLITEKLLWWQMIFSIWAV